MTSRQQDRVRDRVRERVRARSSHLISFSFFFMEIIH